MQSETLEELDKEKEGEDLRKIEAALFLSGRFLKMSELVTLTDVNPIIIQEKIDEQRF